MVSSMADERKPKRRRMRSGYVPKPRAVDITLYSQDGNPIPRPALNEAADAVSGVAETYGLLVNVTEV